MTLKEARLAANLTLKQMSELFEIPQRTLEDWESSRRTPPPYVQKLVINELNRIAKEQG